MSNVKVTEEVSDVLRRSQVVGNLLILPDQLDRKLYLDVAKVLNLNGGVWNKGKKGFIFQSDPKERLNITLESGVVVDKKKLRQAFYTPDSIADEVAILAQVDGRSVLEPSAGDGALARACVKFGAAVVTCIEMEESCKEELEKIAGKVIINDFLSISPPYLLVDRVVMNPPFTKNQYHKHVARALDWLKPGGKLFAIVPDNSCTKLFLLGAVTIKVFPEGSFKESGTNVRTRLILIQK